MSFRGRAQYGQNYRGRLKYDYNFRSDFRRGSFRGPQNYRSYNFIGGYKRHHLSEVFGRGRSRSKERQYSSNFRRNKAIVGQDQVGSRY